MDNQSQARQDEKEMLFFSARVFFFSKQYGADAGPLNPTYRFMLKNHFLVLSAIRKGCGVVSKE